jgi:hypothetical protein
VTLQQVPVVEISQTVVAGNDFDIVGTITSNGATLNVTGYTITASIVDERDHANRLQTGHAVTITTPASWIVTITLTAAESATLHTDPLMDRSVFHLADFKAVAGGGAVVNTDPWRFPVRRAVTA